MLATDDDRVVSQASEVFATLSAPLRGSNGTVLHHGGNAEFEAANPVRRVSIPSASRPTQLHPHQHQHHHSGEEGSAQSDNAPSSQGQHAELLLRNQILQLRAVEDRRATQRLEEENLFLKHQMSQLETRRCAEKDALTRQTLRVQALERAIQDHRVVDHHNHADATHHRHDKAAAGLQSELTEARAQLLAARRLIHSVSGSPQETEAALSAGAAVSAPFRQKLAERVCGIRYEKRLRLVQERMRRFQESMETSLMEKEDALAAALSVAATRRQPPHHLDGNLQGDDELALSTSLKPPGAIWSSKELRPLYMTPKARGTSVTADSAGNITLDMLRRGGFRFSTQAPGLGSITGATANDLHDLTRSALPHMDLRLKASGFGEPLAQLRAEAVRLALDTKSQVEAAMHALWFVFLEASKRNRADALLTDPRQDFVNELRCVVAKVKALGAELVSKMDHHVRNVMSGEKAVKSKWLAESVSRQDIALQCDLPAPEDPRIADLRERNAYLTDRLGKQRDEFAVKVTRAETLQQEADCRTRFLNSQLSQLHTATTHALAAVYRHRYHWTHRCPAVMPLPACEGGVRSAVNVVRLGELIQRDVQLLGTFQDYFTSDESFGVDFAAGGSHTNSAASQTSNRPAGGFVGPRRRSSAATVGDEALQRIGGTATVTNGNKLQPDELQDEDGIVMPQQAPLGPPPAGTPLSPRAANTVSSTASSALKRCSSAHLMTSSALRRRSATLQSGNNSQKSSAMSSSSSFMPFAAFADAMGHHTGGSPSDPDSVDEGPASADDAPPPAGDGGGADESNGAGSRRSSLGAMPPRVRRPSSATSRTAPVVAVVTTEAASRATGTPSGTGLALPLPPSTAAAALSSAHGGGHPFGRMEQWQRSQAALWEERRRSMAASLPPFPVILAATA